MAKQSSRAPVGAQEMQLSRRQLLGRFLVGAPAGAQLDCHVRFAPRNDAPRLFQPFILIRQHLALGSPGLATAQIAPYNGAL
jgi:hypothetical protein